MPFIPDVYDLVIPVRVEGTERTFAQQAIDLIFFGDNDDPQLHVERVRRSNSNDFIEPRLWKLGKPRPFLGDKNACVFTMALTFEGDEFTKQLLNDCYEPATRLLGFIKTQARLHLEVVDDKKFATNLFINLEYRLKSGAPRPPKPDVKTGLRT